MTFDDLSIRLDTTAVMRLMTKDEARQCIEDVHALENTKRTKLLELYERRGWDALGYLTWQSCCESEFPQWGRTYIHYQIQAGEIERQLIATDVHHGEHQEIGFIPERHLRPLSVLPPEQQAEAYHKAVETAPNGKVTAAHVARVVQEHRQPTPVAIPLPGTTYICPSCSDVFDIQVWHCPKCDHHWQMHRTECWNCHEYSRIDPASVALDEGEPLIKHEEQIAETYAPPRAAHQLLNQSESNEWYTPREYLDAAHELLGGIDLDPASNAFANQNVRAERIYTLDTDGYTQPWAGRVWLNPPYGRSAGKSNQAMWSSRLIALHARGAGPVTEALLLVNAAPGNAWFAPLWDFPICFISQRIRFYTETGDADAPTQSNVIVYLGPQVQRFIMIFSRFGPVVARLGASDNSFFIDLL